MIEMALVLPIYLLLCWGFLYFSFIFFGYCNATYAAKMAVRYAAFHGSTSPLPCSSTDLSNIASGYLFGAPRSGVTITSSWSPGSDIGNSVTVTITITYATGIPFSNLRSVTIGTAGVESILE